RRVLRRGGDRAGAGGEGSAGGTDGRRRSEAGGEAVTGRRAYRYYDFVMAAFVTVLVCSNLIGPAKIAQVELPVLGAVSFGSGVLFFPISYVFGDILTEVYG